MSKCCPALLLVFTIGSIAKEVMHVVFFINIALIPLKVDYVIST